MKSAEHLVELCRRFGSNDVGERAAAALQADKHIRRLGLRWHDVIALPMEWQVMAKVCRERARLLSDGELQFVSAIASRRRAPTGPQLRWLGDIFDRVRNEPTHDPRL